MERRELLGDRLELVESLLAGGRIVRVQVTGRSMVPAIRHHDVVHLSHARKVDVGEVVLVRTGGRPLLHRVCARERRDGATWIQTRGDALPHADGWFPCSRIVGRAILVKSSGTNTLLGWLRRAKDAVLSKASDPRLRIVVGR